MAQLEGDEFILPTGLKTPTLGDPQLHCWLDHRDFHGRSFDGGLMAAIFDAIRWLVIGGESLVTCLGDGVLGTPGRPKGC